ncbi:Cytolysin/lectin [Hypoxylon sp. FL0890]|nr:Cytolysin/lectin [Hypoxylon sp. FL0890]
MSGSGTSGMLRFVAEEGQEPFWVVMGVDGNIRWVDIVTNLAGGDTCVKSPPDYYNNTNPSRVKAREARHDNWAATNAKGTRIPAKYTVGESQNLELNIVIG